MPSRRITGELDLLLLVSDPSLRGVATAQRLARVPDEVETRVAAKALVVNRVPQEGLSPAVQERIDGGDLRLAGTLPEDDQVARCDRELGSFASLFPDSRLAHGLAGMLGDLRLGRHDD